jgi:hypothetical protein
MTIAEAKEKGVLGLAVQSEIVESVAESIKTNKAYIAQAFEKAKESRTKPHAALPPPKSDKPFYTGLLPTHSVKCSAHKKHPDNFVKTVFNAGFEFDCGCKWQLVVGQGDLPVIIECDGLQVKYD